MAVTKESAFAVQKSGAPTHANPVFASSPSLTSTRLILRLSGLGIRLEETTKTVAARSLVPGSWSKENSPRARSRPSTGALHCLRDRCETLGWRLDDTLRIEGELNIWVPAEDLLTLLRSASWPRLDCSRVKMVTIFCTPIRKHN